MLSYLYSLGYLYSFVLIAIEAIYFLYWRERSWTRVVIPRRQIAFPPFCPSCVSGKAELPVLEASFSRTIGLTRKEFLTVSVPYCTACGTAINRTRERTWRVCALLAAFIFAGSWLWIRLTMPEGHEFLGTASLIGLPVIWPIYSILSHRKRALAVRRYNANVMDVRVKEVAYARTLLQINGFAVRPR